MENGNGTVRFGGIKQQRMEDRKERFLEAFARTGVIAHACKLSGVGRKAVWEWNEKDALFHAQFNESKAVSTEVMEAEAIRRAVKGITRPVYQTGRLVGHVREFSDILLIFMLKSRKPEVYRDRYDVRVQGNPEWIPLADLLADLPADDSQVAVPVSEGADDDAGAD